MVFAGGEIDRFFARVGEEARLGGCSGLGWLGLGDGGRCHFLNNRIADSWSGFGWAVNLDETLIEPKADFFKTTLGFVGHLKKINFGLVMMVEIISNDVLEFGIGASTDIAGDIVAVFIHDKEDIGTVKIFPEAFVGAKETLGISTVARSERLARVEARNWAVLDGVFIDVGIILENWSGPINDFVTATLEITSPVDGTFVKFGATADNEFFHNLNSPPR